MELQSHSPQALFLLAVYLLLLAVLCSPPEDPIKCESGTTNCTITNSYGTYPDRTACRAARAVFPETEAELLAAVAAASRSGTKMKAATRHVHSISKLSCPDGDHGLIISTKNLNRVVSINASALLLTVESGILLRDLIKAAGDAGLALPCSPYFSGVTVGGLLATGAHGSSLWGIGASVHDYVVDVRIVTPASPAEGYAIVRSLEKGHPDLDAVRVSLGVLGIISEVTFKLEPLFKRSVTYAMREEDDFVDNILSFGEQYEFGDITWYPGNKKVLYRKDSRVSANDTGNGQYDALIFRSANTTMLSMVRSTEESIEMLGDVARKCVIARSTYLSMSSAAYGLTNDGLVFKKYPVVGLQHHIQASSSCLNSIDDGLSKTCPWDSRINGSFIFDTSFTIVLSKVKDFILDIQELRKLHASALCNSDISHGILARYVKASSACLSHEKDSVAFDISIYRGHDPLRPRLYEDIFEEIEQIALLKYGALPHWGKNRNIAFDGVISKYSKIEQYLNVKNKHDPKGLFSSEWSDHLLGIGGKKTSLMKNGCALEGLCICFEDRHCAPDKGYVCRPGKVYNDARVCTLK